MLLNVPSMCLVCHAGIQSVILCAASEGVKTVSEVSIQSPIVLHELMFHTDLTWDTWTMRKSLLKGFV